MRSYPTNSPQAAARIVALTVVADGDIGDAEIEWLDRLRLTLLRVCVELAEVDGHVDEGESSVLVAAVEHWGLHHEMFRPSSQN